MSASPQAPRRTATVFFVCPSKYALARGGDGTEVFISFKTLACLPGAISLGTTVSFVPIADALNRRQVALDVRRED